MTTLSDRALLAVKNDIQAMRTRGAGQIGRQALQALASAAQGFPDGSMKSFRVFLLQAAKLLAGARPTAVTLRNALNRALTVADGAADVDEAKQRLAQAADEYSRHVDEARRAIAQSALALFKPRDVVLTHCHSTTAGAAIAEAARRLRGLRVYSTETRPFRQGLIQAPALAREGVHVSLIVDSAVAHVMETQGVTRVVVGADTIAADGSLYNKVGTRQVAELARRFRVPFIVCAESDKLSPYTLKGQKVVIEERSPDEIARPEEVPGVKIVNPVFDRTPPGLIAAIVTEKGVLKPRQVRALIQKEYGKVRLWI